MKRVHNIILIIAAAFLIIGCTSVKEIPVQTIRTDSIYIREIVRDTVINTQIEREYIQVAVPDTLSTLTTKYATSTAAITNNTLNHSLEQHGNIPINIKYKDRVIEKVIKEEIEIPVIHEVVKEKRYIPKIFWYSIILNLLTIGYFGIKIYRKIKKV